MSETTETTATETSETTETGTETQPKPTETVDFWKQKAREQEKRAKDNAEAAKRLAEIEEASKSEAEKAADRIAKAEAEVASVPAKVADALRESLVVLGVVPEDRKVLLTASDPESLLEQVKAIQGLVKDTRQSNNFAPHEGNNPTSTGDQSEVAFARALFSGE